MTSRDTESTSSLDSEGIFQELSGCCALRFRGRHRGLMRFCGFQLEIVVVFVRSTAFLVRCYRFCFLLLLFFVSFCFVFVFFFALEKSRGGCWTPFVKSPILAQNEAVVTSVIRQSATSWNHLRLRNDHLFPSQTCCFFVPFFFFWPGPFQHLAVGSQQIGSSRCMMSDWLLD